LLTKSLISANNQEDGDLALAKILQEQERAFLSLSQGQAEENSPPASNEQDDFDGLTDEEVALRLQQQETAEFDARLRALAGIPSDGMLAEDDNDADNEEGVDPDNLSYEELSALGDAVGTVDAGVSQADVASLPVVLYAQLQKDMIILQARSSDTTAEEGGMEQGQEEEEEEEQCAVCRVEFEGEDEVKVLPCKHHYHVDCIDQWLKRKKACPVCSQEVVFGCKKEL
jgi:E3 ubiquitin-protein ligase BIG BROTHER-like protein